MKLDNTLFWHDAGGCHWCGRSTDSMTDGHDGMCPVPLLVIFEAENERLLEVIRRAEKDVRLNLNPMMKRMNMHPFTLMEKDLKKALGGES